MITLKKISRISGFSVSTVSKALNDKHDINIDTKRIIQEIATKNNYKPNKNALALRVKKSNIIAIVVPQINDMLYSELLSDMHRTASKIGYRIMVFQSFEEIKKLEKCIEEVNDGSVDAAIVLSNNPIEIGMRYKGDNDVYIEYIHLLKNHSKADLKGYCISIFEKLLNKIN